MSEPKFNPTTRKGKLAAPVPCVSGIQVLSSRYLLEKKGRGDHRAPISPQQPRKEEPCGKEKAPEGPEPG